MSSHIADLTLGIFEENTQVEPEPSKPSTSRTKRAKKNLPSPKQKRKKLEQRRLARRRAHSTPTAYPPIYQFSTEGAAGDSGCDCNLSTWSFSPVLTPEVTRARKSWMDSSGILTVESDSSGSETDTDDTEKVPNR